MSETLSPEQVRDKYVAAMPGSLGEAFYALYNEVAWLYYKWDDYSALFGDNETIDVLNSTAGPFFHDVQHVLRESILLHMCRLTDPLKSAGKENLTLRALAPMLPADEEASFRNALDAAVDDAISKTGFARQYRNKRLAHSALPPAAGGEAVVLPAASMAEMSDAIEAIGAAMNCVERHYMQAMMQWSWPSDTPLGVAQLLVYLRKGLEAVWHEESRWKQG